MKKFINFCKKPLLIASSAVFAAFLIVLIVVSCLSHGKTYSLEMNMGFATMKEEIVLKSNDVVEVNIYVNDELMPNMGARGTYKIANKTLYVTNSDGETEKLGKIDAYKIDLDLTALLGDEDVPETVLAMVKDAKMTCELNVNLRTTAIVFMSVFGVVAAACLVLFVLDKKGVIKYKEKSTEVNSTTSTVEE